MKWSWARFFIILTVLILLAGIVMIVFMIHSRRRSDEYKFQVEMIFALASVSNEDTLSADPEKSVITSWEGKKWAVSPNNYSALIAYLRRDAGMPLFMRKIDPDQCLTIICCNEAVFRVVPEDESGEAVLIELTAGGETFRMRANGGLLWKELLSYSTEGKGGPDSDRKNLLIEE